MSDKLVFDIETKNSFADVGGQENLKQLAISVVGVYSYKQDFFYCYEEHEFGKLAELMKKANLLIGFSSKRFDLPILGKYFEFNLAGIDHFDILEEIEKIFGRRIGLGALAEANLGIGKTGKGLEAIELYRTGQIEKLKKYCLQDVKLTKDIFELIRNRGFLWIPQRDLPQMIKIPIVYKEKIVPQAQLL